MSSTKLDPSGRPVKQSYQTKTNGVYNGGRKPEILERKQMYQNSDTGYEKAAVERMYQGKGRKVVYENDRGTGNKNSYNYYKGLREQDAGDFDQEWDNAAKRMGFSTGSKALGFGDSMGSRKAYSKSKTYGYGGMDEGRRGHYVPDRAKGIDMPVNMREGAPTHVERLQPADTGHRLDVPQRETGGAPIALPAEEGAGHAQRPARNYNGGHVNSRAPNRGAKQARWG